MLTEHGDNVDAAIRHLNELRLTKPTGPSTEQHIEDAGAAEQQQQSFQAQSRTPLESAESLSDGQHQQQRTEAAGRTVDAASWSADDWVEVVVREMSAASDLADARMRAAAVLQAFEQAVAQRGKQCDGMDGAERLRTQLHEALRENQLLKRAVAIQNSRLQVYGCEGWEGKYIWGLIPLERHHSCPPTAQWKSIHIQSPFSSLVFFLSRS